jgi:hypothetical protein
MAVNERCVHDLRVAECALCKTKIARQMVTRASSKAKPKKGQHQPVLSATGRQLLIAEQALARALFDSPALRSKLRQKVKRTTARASDDDRALVKQALQDNESPRPSLPRSAATRIAWRARPGHQLCQ